MNKEMQRNRVMSDFINATNKLIRKDGIENISLRKVANLAGYNSATLYNYFENLDHLIFFGAMKYLNKYTRSLSNYLKESENSMDRFLKVWEHFCNYAYSEPQIYNAIFFPNLNKEISHYMNKYYEFFPEELKDNNIIIQKMLITSDLDDRSMILLENCLSEGYLEAKDTPILNDIILIIFEGMFNRILNDKITYKDAMENTMNYFKLTIKNFLVKDYDFYF